MSYSFDLIVSLPDSKVLDLIHTVDPNYKSSGRDFDQYSLAYIASQTGQLISLRTRFYFKIPDLLNSFCYQQVNFYKNLPYQELYIHLN